MKRPLFLFTILLTGCVPLGPNTHLVLGIGMIRTSQTNQVTVARASALGIYAGDRRLAVGMSKTMIVTIPTNSEAVLEIK